MITGVFAAPDLHRLMFGLLYPAVLGTLFFSLLPKLSRICSRKRAEAKRAANVKTAAGCLVVLHFIVDFQLTSSLPAREYSLRGFAVDLLILFALFVAFDSVNVGRLGELHVWRSAAAVAVSYLLFLLWSLVTLGNSLEYLPLWVTEVVGFSLFMIVMKRRSIFLLCLSLAIMAAAMAWVGSETVSLLRETAAGRT